MALAQLACRGELNQDRLRVRDDGLTLRVMITPEQTVILKLWKRTGIRLSLRRWSRTEPSLREWRALKRLRTLGVRAPRPLHACSLRGDRLDYTDAIFLEDLGSCENGLEHLKRLVTEGREGEAGEFERALIAVTAAMVGGRLLDPDHRITNFLATSKGEAVRIDLELARSVVRPFFGFKTYGLMLGRLVATHCFAVQPDTSRSTRFACELADTLQPPRRVLEAARAEINGMLGQQRESSGINSRLDLW